ncbi:MAG: C39 family peptidase, partial [Candidatus Babeliales bacterium]
MKRQVFLLGITTVAWLMPAESSTVWSHMHARKFCKGEKKRLQAKNEYIFSQTTTPCTQLLFSWNATRPVQGYFQFYGQVRNAVTKQWYPWHTMVDWGSDIQKSYLQKKEGSTGYYHVRLEVPMGQSADAFRIRVKPFNGATLSDLDSLYVNTVHESRYRPECAALYASLPSVFLAGVPKKSQRTINHARSKGMCSPTSLSMLTEYMCKEPMDPLHVAHRVFDKGLDAYGSWPFNTAHAFEACKGTHNFFVQRLNTFSDLHALLMAGTPVIVSVRGTLKGAQKEYKNGHLLLVVGYDQLKKSVICHDPAFHAHQET